MSTEPFAKPGPGGLEAGRVVDDPAAGLRPPARLPLTGRTVLVVEDSPVQRAHAVALAADLGAAMVLEAGDGMEGLVQLAEHPLIDLLLTDLDMPRMDGVSFIGEFAARGFQPEVIVISAQETSVLDAVGLMAETYGLTVLGVIGKPLRPDRLRELLKAAVPAVRAAAEPKPAHGPERPPLTSEDLRAGLRGHEFICFFQPQLTLQGAVLRGVEALVRWRRPDGAILGPAAFLPQVEADDGLMFDLTMAVLAYVAEQWHGWHRRGLNLEISVNLSARSISAPGFSDLLMAAVERLGLPPRALVFEVTESASVSRLGETLANLVRLRMRGFKLSIDDFGTGFATFEQLERIPFTELKLDQSIVKHLPDSQRHYIVAQSLVQMAQALNLNTVAEGVETLATWKSLRAMGCSQAQGYLVARPMPADQLMAWAKGNRAWLRN